QLYPVARTFEDPCIRCMYGRTTQSFVEGMNNANKRARLAGLDPFTATLELLELERKRFVNQQATAWHRTDRFTEKARAKVEDLMQKAMQYTVKNVYVSPEGKIFSYGTVNGGWEWQVQLSPGLSIESCECGEPVVKGFPCVHMVALALHISLDVMQLVQAWHSTATWQLQFPRDMNFAVPSRNEVMAAAPCRTLKLPSPTANKSGRPKDYSRKKSCLET
ncbi:unnamed protein product, partial [Chrysoparadoxa australica]